MLDLDPSPELAARTLPEIISLLYRDDVRQKHSDKTRLGQEISDFRSEQPPPARESNMKKLGYRSQILVDHLLQAAWFPCTCCAVISLRALAPIPTCRDVFKVSVLAVKCSPLCGCRWRSEGITSCLRCQSRLWTCRHAHSFKNCLHKDIRCRALQLHTQPRV